MKDTSADIGKWMRMLVARCPACGRDIGRHRRAILGTAQTDTLQARALTLAFQEGDWSTIMSLRGGSGPTDFFEVDALSCPESGRLSILQILSYYDPWMDDELLETVLLAADESKAVAIKIAAEAWTTLP